MSVFEPNSRHLREVLIFYFPLKKNATEAHRMLSITCDFDVEDQHGGRKEKIFEDSELEALLAEDSCQTQEQLAYSLRVTQQAISKHLKTIGMIQKPRNWVPYELKPRDVERRFFAYEQLHRKKSLPHFAQV